MIFVDAKRVEHDALVTTLHGWDGVRGSISFGMGAINLVYVSKDRDRTDTYGQQTIRETSVVHQEHQNAGGMYWRLP